MSFDWPFSESFNNFFDVYGQYLVRWMAKNDLTADFCTDIVANPSILALYQWFVDVGHDEYCTLGSQPDHGRPRARGGNAVSTSKGGTKLASRPWQIPSSAASPLA